MSRRLVAFLSLAIAGALLVPAIGVSAHAAYDHSTPNADEKVTTPPASVDVFFKEQIKREAGTYFVHVEDSTGTQVSDGDGVLNEDTRDEITSAIPTTLADGRYIVRWENVSDDDNDEASGGFCFYVNVQPTAADTAECAGLNPTEEPAGSPEATTAATSAATSATTPEASPTVAPTTDNKDNGSNTGVIIGIIVAVVVVVVVGGSGALYMRQRQQG
jgi:methionine-rich copper-binding protein CopC